MIVGLTQAISTLHTLEVSRHAYSLPSGAVKMRSLNHFQHPYPNMVKTSYLTVQKNPSLLS